MIDVTLTIDDTLAGDLRELAATQGISLDEAGRQVLRVGLRQMSLSSIQPAMLELGPLHSSPPSVEQIERMRSPIIAHGPIPLLQLTVFNPPQQEQPANAN